MIPLPNEARLCQRPAADINDEDFVIVAKEQQWARVPWPDAAKCYSLSPRERAGVRGKVHSIFTRVAVPTLRFPLIPLPRGEGNKSAKAIIWSLVVASK